MGVFYKLLFFPILLFRIVASLLKQRAFLKNKVTPLLNQSNFTSIHIKDKRKIYRQYGFGLAGFLALCFSLLQGRKLSKKERYTLSFMGSLTGVYDDLFDELNTEKSHILTLMADPLEPNAKNEHELLFVALHKASIKYSPSEKHLQETLKTVFDAQWDSKKQYQSKLSQKEINEITFFKGSASLLYYRSAVKGIPDKLEYNLLYQMGGLIQLLSDLFDVYKDRENQISTLATTASSVAKLRETYVEEHQKFLHALSQTKLATWQKVQFRCFIHLVLSFGYTCLDHLAESEKQTEGDFILEDFSRAQLICDMEKFKNRYRLIKYYLKSH